MKETATNRAEAGLRSAGPGAQEEEDVPDRQLLTPKALDLLERIADYNYLTMHEVRFIFGNKTWAYKVVKGLRQAGLIADFETLSHPRTGHHLTAKGYRLLAAEGRAHGVRRFTPERYNLFIFRHRMACAKAGLLLDKHPLVSEFLPESRLWKRRRSDAEKLCDGEFWFRFPGGERAERVGLEVELNLKNAEKLGESLRQLRRREDLDQVWWLCDDEGVRRGMRRAILTGPGRASQRHFLALLDEFLAAKGQAELMEPQGNLLSIDPERPTLLPRIEVPEPAPVREEAPAEATPQPEPAPEWEEESGYPEPENPEPKQKGPLFVPPRRSRQPTIGERLRRWWRGIDWYRLEAIGRLSVFTGLFLFWFFIVAALLYVSWTAFWIGPLGMPAM